jgi:hypothetical protein
MAKKIFISPSNQTRNLYAYGNTTEAAGDDEKKENVS